MIVNVEFEEMEKAIEADFGEVQYLPDGGYSKGFAVGAEEGYLKGYSAGTEEGYLTGYSKGTEEGYSNGIYRKNIWNKCGNVEGTSGGITIDYDPAAQEFTINGTTTNAHLIKLSVNMNLDWEIGKRYIFARFRTGGSVTIPNGNIMHSIFTMNNARFFPRITENANNTQNEILTISGSAIEANNNDGFIQYIQTFGSGVSFENYKIRLLVVPETDSAVPWIPHIY